MKVKVCGTGLLLYLTYPNECISYSFKVNSARKYLRFRDFLHYFSQMVPKRIGSETWSLAWAYIREIDDVIDRPRLSRRRQLEILDKEWEVVRKCFDNEYEFRSGEHLRYLWLQQFIDNVHRFYDKSIIYIIKELYESARMDAERRWIILNDGVMRNLLYKKAVCFFKLYFTLCGFKDAYVDKIAEDLGIALGMLDDILDLVYDLRGGYINVTRDELERLGIEADPRDSRFIEELLRKGYFRIKGIEILRLLLRARKLAWRLRNELLRKLVLRLTEVFAAPILENRFIPGERYFFKGGRILLRLLPSNEEVAYRIGHRLIAYVLSFPQISSVLMKTWLRLVGDSCGEDRDSRI